MISRVIGASIYCACCLVASSPVMAQTTSPTQNPGAQAPGTLDRALQKFAEETGYDIIYPKALVRGRQSGLQTDVTTSGNDPRTRLLAILSGSGLVARFLRPDAVLLERGVPEESTATDMRLEKLEVRAPGLDSYRWYGELLLQHSLAIFRNSNILSRRSYELFVYVWVDESGNIIDSRLRGQSDDDNQDFLSVAELLKDCSLDLAPPVGMPQPIGLRIASSY